MTKEINKKVKNTEINPETKLNWGLQRLSLETETSAEFNQVKPRLDKLNREINQVYQVKLRITNSSS